MSGYRRPRPADFPRLKNYTPTRFMLPTSHYDEEKAMRAVNFIEMLCHTKSEWAGQPFWLLPWQESLLKSLFGVIKEDGTRQFRTAFVEIPKKNQHRFPAAVMWPRKLIELLEHPKARRPQRRDETGPDAKA